MTDQEQKTIDKVFELLSDIKRENNEFKNQTTQTVESINKKVDAKLFPVTLEQDILSVTQNSIQAAIKESLTKYDSPLVKLVTAVVNEHSQQLKQIISESFDEVIQMDEFKAAIRDGFSHKVARTIISNNDGLFEKVSNELKQDSVFKAKMSLAVANVVNECLTEKSKN